MLQYVAMQQVTSNSIFCNVYFLQLLDTINQLQQVKALHKPQDRKSAPTTSAEPVAPQTTATVIESLTKPSPNLSSTPEKFPSLQSSSPVHLTDELVHPASGNSGDIVMSGIDQTGTLVEMNVEQVSNVIPSTYDNIKRSILFCVGVLVHMHIIITSYLYVYHLNYIIFDSHIVISALATVCVFH